MVMPSSRPTAIALALGRDPAAATGGDVEAEQGRSVARIDMSPHWLGRVGDAPDGLRTTVTTTTQETPTGRPLTSALQPRGRAANSDPSLQSRRTRGERDVVQLMSEVRAAEVSDLMAQIAMFARDALQRINRIGSADRMSRDDFLALAKEVEQVGELVQQLERANRYVVPALFEVPHGRWRGWSGLANYRNQLVHDFAELSPADLFGMAKSTLALDQAARLLESVDSVALTVETLDLGDPDRVAALPPTLEREALEPGHSIIVFRFAEDGEALAVRSWRDTEDRWRASARWLRTCQEDENNLTLAIRDTEMLLVPTPVTELGWSSPDGDAHRGYSLNRRPSDPFAWMPQALGQTDEVLLSRERIA